MFNASVVLEEIIVVEFLYKFMLKFFIVDCQQEHTNKVKNFYFIALCQYFVSFLKKWLEIYCKVLFIFEKKFDERKVFWYFIVWTDVFKIEMVSKLFVVP